MTKRRTYNRSDAELVALTIRPSKELYEKIIDRAETKSVSFSLAALQLIELGAARKDQVVKKLMDAL